MRKTTPVKPEIVVSRVLPRIKRTFHWEIVVSRVLPRIRRTFHWLHLPTFSKSFDNVSVDISECQQRVFRDGQLRNISFPSVADCKCNYFRFDDLPPRVSMSADAVGHRCR
jgi:hypothetical protein